MNLQFINKYDNKHELEKLKIFLQSVELYSTLLEKGKTPLQIYREIDETFVNYLIGNVDEILLRLEQNDFEYENERERLGIGLEMDALAYACHKMNIPTNTIPELYKRRTKMIVRKR